MLKNICKFEMTIEGKLFQLLCECDSQFNQAKEFAYQFLKYVGQIEDAVKRKQEEENKEKSEEKQEEKIEALND
jgi:conjugal transfer/entry exclusion protein